MHVTSMTINYIGPFPILTRLEMASGTGTQAPITRPGRRMWPIIAAVAIIIIAIVGVFAYVYLMKNAITSNFVCDPTKEGSCTVSLQGTGATFPAPLLQKWTTDYHNLFPNVTITYNALGS